MSSFKKHETPGGKEGPLLAAGEVWKLGLWNSYKAALLHFRCWMILAYSNLDLLGDN